MNKLTFRDFNFRMFWAFTKIWFYFRTNWAGIRSWLQPRPIPEAKNLSKCFSAFSRLGSTRRTSGMRCWTRRTSAATRSSPCWCVAPIATTTTRTPTRVGSCSTCWREPPKARKTFTEEFWKSFSSFWRRIRAIWRQGPWRKLSNCQQVYLTLNFLIIFFDISSIFVNIILIIILDNEKKILKIFQIK